MPVARNLTKQDIERAQKYTKSNRAAARFLGCSYNTYLLYAKMFIDEETGKTLFDKHLNRSGKGIPKWGNNGRDIPVDEIQGMISESNQWVKVVPNTKEDTLKYLSPAHVTGTLEIPVGRIRKLNLGKEYLTLFTVGDQLLWGAAEPIRRMLTILLEYLSS